MVLIHDLRGNILPEAVDDAVHEGVFAQQHTTTSHFLAELQQSAAFFKARRLPPPYDPLRLATMIWWFYSMTLFLE